MSTALAEINVVPLVMGEGKPYFDGIQRYVQLADPEVIEGTRVTHLRYRIDKDNPAPDAAVRETARETAQPGR